VATDVSGCREIVVPGENGLLVDPRDANGLARAVAELIDDPLRRQRLGEKGREIALREFALPLVVAETLGVYRELMKYLS
jgi:glycosyltransferase involved in cell wall biosynthesis